MSDPEAGNPEEIGTVSVDSGNLVIVDPGYLDRAGLPSDAYIGLCVGYSRETEYSNLNEHNRQIEDDRRNNCAPILGGLGVTLTPGFGDGEYKVLVTRTSEGRISKVELTFIDEASAQEV